MISRAGNKTSDDINKWNKIADDYADNCSIDPFKNHFIYQLILDELKNVSSRKILDLGCGNGDFSRILNKKKAKVYAIDGSDKLIQIAKNKSSSKIIYKINDLNYGIDFPDNYFDRVVAIHSLMDIKNYKKVIKESFRILKTKGKIIVTIPHPCFTSPVFVMKRKILGRINLNWSMISWKNYFQRTKSNKLIYASTPATHYHRTIEDYLSEFISNGFTLKKFMEPKIPKQIAKKINNFSANFFPNVILLIFEK